MASSISEPAIGAMALAAPLSANPSIAPIVAAIEAIAEVGASVAQGPVAPLIVIPNIFLDPTAASADAIAKELIIKKPNLEPPAAPAIGTYEELTKRLSRETRLGLEALMEEQKAALEPFAIEFLALIREGKIEDIQAYINARKKEDLFLAAFYGFRKEIVPVNLLLRVAELLSIPDKEIEVMDFLNPDGSVNPKAYDMMIRSTKSFLTIEEQAVLIEKIKAMPREDRLIFEFKTLERCDYSLEYILEEGTRSLKMGEILTGKQGFNLMNFQPVVAPDKRMIGSLAIFQEVLKLQFPESYVTINPVFGISTPSQIRTNGLTQTRDIALHHLVIDEEGKLSIQNYDEADGLPCIENDFEMHDRYHSWVTSSIPVEIKRALIHMADFTADLAKSNKESIGSINYQALRKLGWFLKDMDQRYFTLYRMLRTADEFDQDSYLLLSMLFENVAHLENPSLILGHAMGALAVTLLMATSQEKLIAFIQKDEDAASCELFTPLLASIKQREASFTGFEDPHQCLEFFKILILASKDVIPDFDSTLGEFLRTMKIQGRGIEEMRALDPQFTAVDELPEEIPEGIREALKIQATESMKMLDAIKEFSF